MSRNTKARYAAEQLPPFPKLHNRRIQRDGEGNIIYVNHFRELKRIQDTMKKQGYGPKHPKTAQAWTKYAAMVLAYDKRQKRLPMIEKAFFWVAMAAAAFVIYHIQKFFIH